MYDVFKHSSNNLNLLSLLPDWINVDPLLLDLPELVFHGEPSLSLSDTERHSKALRYLAMICTVCRIFTGAILKNSSKILGKPFQKSGRWS